MIATSDNRRPTALARFLRLVGQMARLLALCCSRREGRRGLFLFGLVLGLNLIGIPITVRLIGWSADFYNALQKADAAAAVEQIGVFAGLTVLSATTFLIASYLRKRLVMLWRRELTSALLDRWLAAQVFWQAGKDGEDAAIENPDQRVGEDAALFLERVLGEEGGRGNVLSLITSVVALVSYVTVLWNLSTFALPLSFLGLSIEIPRYMVWAAPIYVAVSSAITHWLGAPLKNLMFEQQRREGDFRFALARLRENAEPVALAGGQAVERAILGQRFEAIASNWYALIRRELIQGTFTRPYFQTVLRIPMFLALPAFLAGRVTLGGLMQIASAFQNVVTTLSWFIFAYHDLAELAAATSRLDGFLRATERPSETHKDRVANTTPTSPDGLGWRDLRLLTPTGTGLLTLPDAWFEPGAPIWIKAPSGTGKTTLLRAIGGLWPHRVGTIRRPAGTVHIVPQQAYMPLGSIGAATTYPSAVDDHHPEAIARALAAVGMREHAPMVMQERDASHGLSGGERQRLRLAGILLARPDWVFLDEATSALDPEAEASILETLRRALPDTTFVIVSHRRPPLAGLRTYEIDSPRAPRATHLTLLRPAPGD